MKLISFESTVKPSVVEHDNVKTWLERRVTWAQNSRAERRQLILKDDEKGGRKTETIEMVMVMMMMMMVMMIIVTMKKLSRYP